MVPDIALICLFVLLYCPYSCILNYYYQCVIFVYYVVLM